MQDLKLHLYVVIELTKKEDETYFIFDDEHYVFGSKYFFDDISSVDRKTKQLESKGIKYIILNTYAFDKVLIESKMDKLSAQMSITHNYQVKQ